jgi:hypothetical protein
MSQMKAMVDKLLTDVSSGYFPSEFICEKILPEVQSKQSSGKLGKYGTAHLRIENSLKGGRAKYRRVEAITRSTTDFYIEGHGLEGMVTQDDYDNVEDPFKAEEDETVGLTSMLWLEKEKLLADSLANTSVLTQNVTLSGSSQLSDYLNSDPIAAFAAARLAVRNGCGAPPDTGIMDWGVWNKIRFHPAILDALGFKDNRPGGLTESELASAMGVKQLLIGQAVYESAAEGQASSLQPVWGKHIIFAVCPAKAQVRQLSLGYMVRKTGTTPRKVYKQSVFNPPGSTEILVEDNYDMLFSNAGAGYLIKNAIA